MKLLSKVFTLILFFFSCLAAYSQKPDYSGNWILNVKKSHLVDVPKGFTGSVFFLQQNGDKFQLTRSLLFGEKKKKISFKMTADGKTRRVKILFKGKLEWVGDSLKASLWRKGFSNIVVYNFGSNKNEFIADEVMKTKYQQHHNIWFFESKLINRSNIFFKIIS